MQNKTKELVISRYTEDISWVTELEINYFLYNKGEYNSLQTEQLPNIGRESHTYLYHIIKNYKSLSDHIVFLQGRFSDHSPNLKEKLQKIDNFNDKVFNLTETVEYSDHNGLPHHPGLSLHRIINAIGIPVDTILTFYAGAQFIVPKELILNKPLHWWESLMNIHNSEINSPWIFERLWLDIFNCK